MQLKTIPSEKKNFPDGKKCKVLYQMWTWNKSTSVNSKGLRIFNYPSIILNNIKNNLNNLSFFTFSAIRSIEKYCICPKNRLPDFDECSRFEGHRVQKSYFWHVVCVSVCLSVCLSVSVCVCLSVATITQKIIELAQPNLVCDLIW